MSLIGAIFRYVLYTSIVKEEPYVFYKSLSTFTEIMTSLFTGTVFVGTLALFVVICWALIHIFIVVPCCIVAQSENEGLFSSSREEKPLVAVTLKDVV